MTADVSAATGPDSGDRGGVSTLPPGPPESESRAAHRASEPSGPALTWQSMLWTLFAVALTVTCAVVLLHARESDIGGYGLIQALPAAYFVLTGALLVSCVLAIQRDVAGLVLAAHLVGLVLLLHGPAGFIESEPRFPVAWLHAGFANEILHHHKTIPSLDARFNWPGFFAGAAALVGASGMKSAVSLLRWAPVAAVLLYLLPIFAIARHTTRSRRLAWLSLVIFVLIDWVGQDYFAPESFGFFLYLGIVALLLSVFGEGRRMSPADGLLSRLVPPRLRARTASAVDRLRVAVEQRAVQPADAPLSPRTRRTVVVVLTVAVLAQAVSHQLSPVMTIIASVLLVVVGRTRLRALPFLVAVITVTWISLGATAYWRGHLSTIAGNVGAVTTVVSQNVTNRLGSTNVDHTWVVRERLAFTAVVWLIAGASAIALFRQRRLPLAATVLAFAPFVILLGQSYGGEALLRVFLFSSPFSACLIALAVRPLLATARRTLVVAAVALVAMPTFLVAFSGNEDFERVTKYEVRAIQKLWQVAPAHSLVVAVNANIPWRFQRIAGYRFLTNAETNFENMRFQGLPFLEVIMSLNAPPNAKYSYLLVTRGAIALATEFNGARPGWFSDTHRLLTPQNGFDLVYRNRDASLYRFELFGKSKQNRTGR